MGRIVFGYRDLTQESGVVFTASSEHADHDADNLGIGHPSEFWRITTTPAANDPQVSIGSMARQLINIVAPLYVTATPHQALNVATNELDNVPWLAGGAVGLIAAEAETLLHQDVKRFTLTAAGSGEHYLKQSVSFPLEVVEVTQWCLVDIGSESGSANFGLRMIEGANSYNAEFDLDDGSVNGTGGSGLSGTSNGSVLVSGTIWKFHITATLVGSGSVDFRYQVLDSAYAASYAAGSEVVEMGCAMAELGEAAGDPILTLAGSANVSWWKIEKDPVSGGNTDILATANFPLGRDLSQWFESRGWLHSFYYTAAGFSLGIGEIEAHFFSDNSGGTLDVSNIYIGPGWQPEKDIELGFNLSIDPESGGRILKGQIVYASEADALGDSLPMAMKLGVGSRYKSQSGGGAQFRSDRDFVLCIINPEEATFGQETMLYGYLEQFELVARPRDQWDISFTILEVLPL